MAAPPAALLLDELVEEILLRFPPDDPARLFAAALVCKRWCRLITGRGFRRRFRELHRAPPLLGFLFNSYGSRFGFVPTSSFRPRNNSDHSALRAIHSGHGRVLLRHWQGEHRRREPFVVWDPLTDEHQELPMGPVCPELDMLSWSAAVLCTVSDRCDHLDCHRGPFLVVSMGQTYKNTLTSCVYSSEAGSWSEPVSVHAQGHRLCRFELGNVVLVGKALYFKLFLSATEMVKYDLVTRKMSQICISAVSQQHPAVAKLTATDDGRLGCAFVRDYREAARLDLWSRKHGGPDEELTWEQSRVIELGTLLPIDAISVQPVVAGFADNGVGVILIRTCVGDFTIDLRSGTVKKAGESRGYHDFLVPYVSFCTPGKYLISF
ncbi:unnamed protein product [Urochloa decumbens]|uniref:F-box domain-containing protein n=1 Tax=Urochloa decumbens TaxID=240449 RepID=A0ABC9FNK8_9POAL